MLTWVESDELRRLREGDDSAMAAIFDRYADRVKYYVLRQPGTGSEAAAEDITIEAFMKLLSWSRWRDSAYKKLYCIGGFLRDVATKLVVVETRRAKRDEKLKEAMATMPVLLPPEPEAILLSKETQRLLEEAVDSLPPTCQPAARYRYVHGCTPDETAQLTGASKARTEKRLSRARKLLAAALRSHFWGHLKRNDNGNDRGKGKEKDKGKDQGVTQ